MPTRCPDGPEIFSRSEIKDARVPSPSSALDLAGVRP
jgi:hypothetical protein